MEEKEKESIEEEEGERAEEKAITIMEKKERGGVLSSSWDEK